MTQWFGLVAVGLSLGVVSGCDKGAKKKQAPPSCNEVAVKLSGYAGKQDTPDTVKLMTAVCTQEQWSEAKRRCIGDAQTEAQASKCLDDLAQTAPKGEPGASKDRYVEQMRLVLHSAGKNLRVHFADMGGFPAGKVGPAPSEACCATIDKTCAPGMADWADPIWIAAEVSTPDAYRFQLAYEGTATGFVLTGTVDSACDGKVTRMEVHGSAANGAPIVQWK